MTFTAPSDRGYRRAKRVRQGVERLNPKFDRFVARFHQRFGFEPLWLVTGHVKVAGAPLPKARLNVVLERTEHYRTFLDAGDACDASKRHEIARLCAEELTGAEARSIFRLPRNGAPPAYPQADDILVYFSDFERVAKAEAHGLVTSDELAQFVSSLGLGDQFWCTAYLSGLPTVFVYTQAQAAALKSSPVRDRWGDAYFALVRTHDEFGYLERSEIAIDVDSKENFDTNYSGNWYFYVK